MQLDDVRVVRGDVSEEDLFHVEGNPLGALELVDLGEVLGQVLAVDLRRPAERDVRYAQLLQLLRETAAGIEADVMAVSPQPLRRS